MKYRTKILIVEGELPLAMFMVSALSQVGCDVFFAATGRKAMELAAETKYDLIAVDINLPDTSGFEICSELKQRHISYKTPIIFISAQNVEQCKEEAEKRGAVDCIMKPFDVTDFIYRVIYHSKAKIAEGKATKSEEAMV